MRFLLLLSFLFLLPSLLSAQSLAYSYQGDQNDDQFGHTVSGLGDVNNDGFDDFAVGAPWQLFSVFDRAYVRVYSGQDGTVLHEKLGSAFFFDWFAFVVTDVGDVNTDGFDDFAVGAPLDQIGNDDHGSISVYSGQTGSLLWKKFGPMDSFFGNAADGAGDVNQDGVPDVIVGMESEDTNGFSAGGARVLSGIDGSTLYTWLGTQASDNFGRSVGGAGDLNQDGYADVLVGAYRESTAGTNSGRVYAYSGMDGSELFQVSPGVPETNFGYRLSSNANFDGDSIPDFVVAAPSADFSGNAAGSLYVYAGADQSVIRRIDSDSSNDDGLGWGVDFLKDVDGDGIDEVVGGAPFAFPSFLFNRRGLARVYSGATGYPLYSFRGEESTDYFGYSVACGGDLNADGIEDLIIGAKGLSPGITDFGKAYAYYMGDFVLESALPGIAGQVNSFAVHGATAQSKVLLVYGLSMSRTLINNCPLALSDIANPKVGASGFADALGNIDFQEMVLPAAQGRTFFMQAYEPNRCLLSNMVVQVFQ